MITIAKTKTQAIIGIIISTLVFLLEYLFPALGIQAIGFGTYWITDIMNLILSLLPLIIVLYLLKYLKKKLG